MELRKFSVIRSDGKIVDQYCHPGLQKAIVWNMPDGSISITPVDPFARNENESEDEQTLIIVAKGFQHPLTEVIHNSTNTAYNVVDFWTAGLHDRTFRNAFEHDNGAIKINMVKARDIHRNKLRALRKPLFEANDLILRDAILENKDATAAIAKRNALRDVTDDPAIEAAQTPGELISVL